MTESTAVVTRFIVECWNARSRGICRELLAPKYEHFMPGSDTPTIGPDAYQMLVDGFVAGFPDIRFDIVETFGEGNNACVVWVARGTHRGVFNDIEPTNRPVRIFGVAVANVADGQIQRLVSVFDNDSFTRQLDAPAEKAADTWRRSASSTG